VFSKDFVWNKAISFVIREQVLHTKIGRIFINELQPTLNVSVVAVQENK